MNENKDKVFNIIFYIAIIVIFIISFSAFLAGKEKQKELENDQSVIEIQQQQENVELTEETEEDHIISPNSDDWYDEMYANILDMNRRELWYDADGPFIMIDKMNEIIGYYNAITPIYHSHFEVSEYKNIPVGTYCAYVSENIFIIEDIETGDRIYDWVISKDDYVSQTFSIERGKFPICIY